MTNDKYLAQHSNNFQLTNFECAHSFQFRIFCAHMWFTYLTIVVVAAVSIIVIIIIIADRSSRSG